jgi:3-deoxy-manno-octulosonate cytidylyltransferase (CMP-KDO synthetase)
MVRPIIVIPARMAAERLPGKPLLELGGVPLIVHVWRGARQAALGPVVVATDAPEIAQAIALAGGTAILTGAAHETGSDRAFEAVQRVDAGARHDVVINLQSDLPGIDPQAIRRAANLLDDAAVDIGTLAVPTADRRENPHVVKVIGTPVSENRLRALYFTRAAAPWGDGGRLRHVGCYAFRRTALARFAALPRSQLERRERLEQLRALEAGMRIDVALLDKAPPSIDTPADLGRARADLETNPPGGSQS